MLPLRKVCKLLISGQDRILARRAHMSAQSPVGAKIPATTTVRRAIEVTVLCTTSLNCNSDCMRCTNSSRGTAVHRFVSIGDWDDPPEYHKECAWYEEPCGVCGRSM